MLLLAAPALALTSPHQIQLWQHLNSTSDTCDVVRTWAISTFGVTCPGVRPSLTDTQCYGRLNLVCTYPDVDADGYDVTTDCDDGDPGVNPGEPEVCMDGVDQNCDGWDQCGTGDLYRLMDGLGSDYPVSMPTEVDEDLTGDGIADLVSAGPGGIGAGGTGYDAVIHVYAGPIGPSMSTTPAHVLDSASQGWVGQDLDVGDLNGDGYADLLTSGALSSLELGAGTGYVFFGPLTAADENDADFKVEASGYVGEFGWALDIVGDVTGDGTPDWASGDMPYPGYAGGYYAFSGSRTGSTSTATADFTVDMGSAAGSFCRPLGPVGDVNADGFDDLALGDRSYGGGRVAIFFGPVSGTTTFTASDMYYSGDGAVDFALNIAPIGDANSDGTNDVAVTNGYATYLLTDFDGANHAVSEALASLAVGGAWLQGEVAWGDFDGDGHGDVLTTDSYGASVVEGIMALYTGPFAGSYGTDDAARGWVGDGATVGLGYDAENLGDIDADGRDDFLTVAVGDNGSGGYPGAFFLGYGSLLP